MTLLLDCAHWRSSEKLIVCGRSDWLLSENITKIKKPKQEDSRRNSTKMIRMLYSIILKERDKVINRVLAKLRWGLWLK